MILLEWTKPCGPCSPGNGGPYMPPLAPAYEIAGASGGIGLT
jgi:hypothetical protein